MKRVFVSSVMRDYVDRRNAARSAISTLDHQPVMAEDFGALPHSAQTACLEGVRSSDLYVGIFGERYGDLVASGVSPTEEEFNEARERGLMMLCFVENGDKDGQQQQFLKRIKKYEDGLTIESFATSDELERKIIKALHRAVGQPTIADLNESSAADLLARHNWGAIDDRRQWHIEGPTLGMVVVPTRYGREYFSWRQLAKQETRDEFLQAALFGSRRVFDARYANEVEDGDDFVEFRQVDGHRQQLFAMFRVFVDGTLNFTADLTDREQRRWNYASLRSMIIDQAKVESRITDFAYFADSIYGRLPQSDLLSAFYLGMSLFGISGKHFGRLGNDSPRSLSGSSLGIDDPLRVPPAPFFLSRAQLRDGKVFSKDLCDQIARKFRKLGAFYESAV